MSLENLELLELKYLTQMINERLGDDFFVSTNAQPNITKSGRIQVVLSAERIPFAIYGINSETINVSITAYIIAGGLERDKALKSLNKLIGTYRGTIVNDDGATYNYMSFLDFNEPLGAPNIDKGNHMQTLLIRGTILVSNAATGAIFSNDVLTKLSFELNGKTYSGFIPTLRVSAELNYNTETAPIGNNHTVSVMNNARGTQYSIVALTLNRDIDYAILSLPAYPQLHLYMTLERHFPPRIPGEPHEVSTHNCIVSRLEIIEQAGAYAQYDIGLQVIE